MTEKNKLSRRGFLSNAVNVVTGTATGVVLSKAVSATPITHVETEKELSPPQSKGYQRTEHVDTYYKLTDF
jgi:hypothetical protein